MEEKRWDLGIIYSGFDSPQLQSDMQALAESVDAVNALAESAKEMKPEELIHKYIGVSEKYAELCSKIYIYASLAYSADTSSPDAQSVMGRVMDLMSRTAAANATLSAAIADIGGLDGIIAADGSLSEYAFMLKSIKEDSKYLLSDKEEAVFAKMSISGSSAWEDLQSSLTSSVTSEYRGGQLNLPALKNLAFDPDASVRLDAYNAERECCEKIKTSVAFSLNSIKLQVLNECEMRGFDSPLGQALHASRMQRTTLDALISAMEEFMPDFRRYYKAKAEYLGYKNGLPWYELYAPVGEEGGKRYTTDEARDYLLDIFDRTDKDIADVIRDAFSQNWIDFFPREGKVGGAFDCGVPCAKQSRVLTNFSGSFSDVVTLAHELGHAFHDRQVFPHSILTQDYTMPVAETASTFNEILVKNRAIKDAATDAEKLSLLEGQLQDLGQIICDIYSRYLFETSVFENRPGEFMSADRFCELMHEAQLRAYGDSMQEDTMNRFAWLSKSHYYSGSLSFYNFPYAFGGLFGQGLYAKYEREGEAFFPTYKAMLRATPVNTVEGAALIAGIDLTDREFWRQGLLAIREKIDMFCEMAKAAK